MVFKRFCKAVAVLVGASGTVIMTVTPKGVDSQISAWLEWLNIKPSPDFSRLIQNQGGVLDKILLCISLIIFFGGLIWIFWPWFEKFFSKTTIKKGIILSLGTGPNFEKIESSGNIYTSKKTIRVEVKNNGEEIAKICKFSIDLTKDGNVKTYQMGYQFPLYIGENNFLDIASYDEARERHNISQKGTISLNVRVDRPFENFIDKNKKYPLTIKAVSMNYPAVELKCELWVDENDTLQMKKVG